ncbi:MULTISPECIES: ComF family protein [unclassified Francisella]|uniref:ComF family protein n=1 Tax=unclassified Francisella TaxID=2610885 RepID=UPI002E31FD92|nr:MULTISPECIES: ComF family protein [unclassified Francisella]MED7820117.1 ComF family protein [Francisella sp. 19S2-4]MED7830937.1 ComF family protein [Francisella sp. 19S2-10]
MYLKSGFLFKQNCLLCKQSSDDIICNYCFEDLLQHLNFKKQTVDLDQEYDYYHLLKYSAEVKYLLQKFKFQKDLLSARIFSKVMKYWWDNISKEYLNDVDALAVVPIHRFRYLYRGFNQAEVLITELSEYTNIPKTFESYSRIKYTKSQARSTKEKRAEQIKGVFILNKPIIAKHLLVFDDVLTTGSTVKEFIKAIKANSKIDKISVVTLVRPNNL